jgi:hypothetical protein
MDWIVKSYVSTQGINPKVVIIMVLEWVVGDEDLSIKVGQAATSIKVIIGVE